MLVGITYDLRDDYLQTGFSEEETAEFDCLSTIEAIENALQELGYQTERVGNAQQLTKALNQGNRWDLVFNICEGMYGIGREAQVPAILDVYNLRYTFSDVLTSALTLHKGITKRVIRDCQIPTAGFFVVEKKADIQKVDLPFPLFAKPVAEGTGKGVDSRSKVHNQKELQEVCEGLLTRYKQPVLVETFLPGREFTVGIVGTGEEAKSIGVLEVILKENAEANAYSYMNKEKCEELIDYIAYEGEWVPKIEEVALKSWRSLNCRDGGRIDLKLDENNVPNFLEVNPLSGLHPEHSDLPILAIQKGIKYIDLIKMIVDSAFQRM